MWNSPKRKTDQGKRYQIAELSVLIYPIDFILDSFDTLSPQEIFYESILSKLDKEEFLYTLYQVFQALLEDTPVPEKGHTGIHEATIAELLHFTCEIACDEIHNGDLLGDYATTAAWESVQRLLIYSNPKHPVLPSALKDAGFTSDEPITYRSNRFTAETWQELITGESGLWNEFFWDTDWRLGEILDLPPDQAQQLAKQMGINLDTTLGLAETPSKSDLDTAMDYLRMIQTESCKIYLDLAKM